ncbi:hypothetical protein [Acetobacter sp.]|uniref:hypothetical protein n=1 Tax=Acetobacter sp. TaxID=440 RepID=UPI0039E73A21
MVSKGAWKDKFFYDSFFKYIGFIILRLTTLWNIFINGTPRKAVQTGQREINAGEKVCVLVSAAGFEPTAPGFIPLQLSLPLRCRSVCGLDCPFTIDLR